MGITLDAERMEACLPDDKIIRMKWLLVEFQNKTTCTLKQLLTVFGVLNLTCSVIRTGRASLRTFKHLTIGFKVFCNFLKINKEAQLNVLLWLIFLSNLMGKPFSCIKNKLVVMHFS